MSIDSIPYREMLLQTGNVTLVDAADYDALAHLRWFEHYSYPYTWDLIRDKRVNLHRWLMGMPKGIQVDHINHDPLDNRRANLRLATPHQNAQNKRGGNSANGYKGITQRHQYTWEVRVGEIYVGSRRTAEEAARLYDEEAIKKFGEFACLNFPNK